MTFKAETFHQDVMNAAYDRWQSAENMSKEAFWATLSQVEKRAVWLGNFNYQVCNGGFGQWLGNGYATAEVVTALGTWLGEMNTPAAQEVRGLLAKFATFCNRKGWDDNRWDEEDYEDFDELGLDSPFYKVNDQFMVDMNAWLVVNFGPKDVTPEQVARLSAELRNMADGEFVSNTLSAALREVAGDPTLTMRFADLLQRHATPASALKELVA